MTLMTAPIKSLTDFERGQREYLSGLRVCPFKIVSRKEAWRDGWLTQQAQK